MKKLKFKNGQLSLAEGEGAGKHHILLEQPEIDVFRKDTDTILIKTGAYETKLTHPEHAEIIIPAQTELEIFVQEEYDPEHEYRKIRD